MPNSKNYDLDTDTTLGGNNASDYVIPSQKAIKDYVDNHSGGGTVDQTYDPTSANAQSGVAIAGAGFGKVKTVNNNQPDANGNVTIAVSSGANTDLSNLTSTGEAHFQKPLVSGTNIKTINSTSLLGSGNISISGGHTWGTTRPTSTTSTVSSTNPAVVVTNYVNGTSWYRLYSDKWCEQGNTEASFPKTATNINFLKTFVNTNYTIIVTPIRDSSSTYGEAIMVQSKSTSYFTAHGSGAGATAAKSGCWYACGYVS